MRGLTADDMISRIEAMGDDFTPDLAIDYIRDRLTDDDPEMHVLCDLIEGLHDENQRLRSALDQSNGETE